MSELSAELVAPHLQTERYGRSLDVRDVTESTNDDARRAASEGAPDGHVVVADAQSAGRGRQGHAWSSPPGEDLYFSVVARTGLPAADLPPLTLAVGIAVAEVVEELTGRPAQLKWPNDVWLEGRKLAGILVETSTRNGRSEAAVIGVGLNVNRVEFPEDLRAIATSLATAAGEELDRAEVLAQVLTAMEAWVDRLVEQGPAPVVDALDRRLAFRGERVRIDSIEGTLEGVSPSGAALIQTPTGAREVTAGTLQRLAPPTPIPET